jgi:antitoxin (DNA-binding transcriptional repressor) of toxin-antitoxin stability system
MNGIFSFVFRMLFGHPSTSLGRTANALEMIFSSIASARTLIIVRRGKPVARLTAVRKSSWRGFPDRSALRASLPESSESAAETVHQLRNGERC